MMRHQEQKMSQSQPRLQPQPQSQSQTQSQPQSQTQSQSQPKTQARSQPQVLTSKSTHPAINNAKTEGVDDRIDDDDVITFCLNTCSKDEAVNKESQTNLKKCKLFAPEILTQALQSALRTSALQRQESQRGQNLAGIPPMSKKAWVIDVNTSVNGMVQVSCGDIWSVTDKARQKEIMNMTCSVLRAMALGVPHSRMDAHQIIRFVSALFDNLLEIWSYYLSNGDSIRKQHEAELRAGVVEVVDAGVAGPKNGALPNGLETSQLQKDENIETLYNETWSLVNVCDFLYERMRKYSLKSL